MEDYYYAGGLPAVLREIGRKRRVHRDAITVNGKIDLGERRRKRRAGIAKSFLPTKNHSKPKAGITVLRGNLAPDGAVIKLSAASPHLLQHRGRAVVLRIDREFHTRIEDTRISTSTKIA